MSLVAIQIPQPIYNRLERAAARLHKPVQDLLVETLQVALPQAGEIPANIQAEVESLVKLGEAELRDMATSDMATTDQQALDHLLDMQGLRPLTSDESARLENLRMEYGRVLLCKARAFALLAERGQPLAIE
jgi:hypothetical protein